MKATAPAPAGIAETSTLHDEIRLYRFITPVFGGGVQVEDHRKPFDERTPIRVPSVRGQLRFWWRATNPRGCRDVRSLHAAEAEVFGTAAGGVNTAGVLEVSVESQPGKPNPREVLLNGSPFATVQGREILAYGAFPLRDTDRTRNQHGALHEYTREWSLRLRYREAIANDIEAALWAWAHFGGLGGRTRRGFGAIRQLTPGLPSVSEGWSRWVKSPSGSGLPWPHLSPERARVTAEGQPRPNGADAHDAALGLLREMRQGAIGRNRTSARAPNRPGRSFWPEADVIRAEARITGGPHGDPVSNVRKVPRALFGMPIITHFKTEPGEREPRDSTMLPKVGRETKTRWASPLLLRPLCLGDGRFVPHAVRLRQTEPDAVAIQGIAGARDQSYQLTPEERRSLRPFAGQDSSINDVIDLYFHLLRNR